MDYQFNLLVANVGVEEDKKIQDEHIRQAKLKANRRRR